MFFKDVTGQEDVKKRLIKSVVDQRVSHAQLFYGPAGTGKLALADSVDWALPDRDEHAPVAKHGSPDDLAGAVGTVLVPPRIRDGLPVPRAVIRRVAVVGPDLCSV